MGYDYLQQRQQAARRALQVPYSCPDIPVGGFPWEWKFITLAHPFYM